MKKLLLVDDNMDFLRLLSSKLKEDFQVYEASGVSEAMNILEIAQVDAICSDFNMRDGTGLELLEKLYLAKRKIPFLLMSGNDDSRLAAITESYGAVFCCKTDLELLKKIKNI
jgi:DNA-binding NtrC family response regulator